MIVREYAFDPELLANAAARRLLRHHIGATKGRLIGCSGPAWIERLQACYYESLGVLSDPEDHLEMEMICSMLDGPESHSYLQFRKESAKGSGGSEDNWVDVVQDAHAKCLYDLVITDVAVSADDFHHRVSPPGMVEDHRFWNPCERDLLLERVQSELAEALKVLVSASREIRFVDPYFDPRKKKQWLELPCAILTGATAGPFASSDGLDVQFHHTPEGTDDFLLEKLPTAWAEYVERFPGRIRSAKLVVREKYKVHDRAVLTNIGGVSVSTGFELPQSERAQEETHLFLLNKENWNKLWNRWSLTTASRVAPIRFVIDETGRVI